MGVIEPLLLVGASRDYRAGDRITVDGRPALVRRVLFDSGTVLRAEIEVYESKIARELDELRDWWTT